jgi:YidC/Oxa1 family membrane protein insertase
MMNNNNGISQDDQRNLIIFCLVSLLLYLGYDHFIMAPQKEALEKAKQARQTETAVVHPIEKEEQPLERKEVLTKATRVHFHNDNMDGSISLIGGRLDDATLNTYFKTLAKKEPVEILSPAGSAYPRYIGHGWVPSNQNIAVPDKNTQWQVSGNTQLSPSNDVTLIWNNGSGLTFKKTFSLDNKNLITLTQSVQNNTGAPVTLHPYGLVAQRGLPEVQQGTWILHEGPIGYVGEELHEESYKDLRKSKKVSYQASQGWTGITDKYWLTTVIPPQGQSTQYTFNYVATPPGKNQKDTGLYQADYTGAGLSIPAGGANAVTSHIYVGPKRIGQLQAYGEQLGAPRFDIAVNFGSLWFLSKPFFHALHFLGELIGNFGVAIIVFTFVIRMAVFPLTNASFKSFAKMKKASPKIKELRQKYGDDKQTLQKELMAMYQKEGVNPLAGCIPMIIQIPIFFALYRVLFITIEMRHAPFVGWIQDLSAPDPTSIFNLFGLIPWDPPSFLHVGVWPCLMLLAMIVQRKLNPPPQDPIQRDMALYFPFIMAYMMSRFASGLVIYWTFSALFSVAQQMFIMKRMGVPIYILGQSPEEKELEEEIDKGPALHPLTEMAEDEAEHALFDEHGDETGPEKPVKKKGKGKKKK